VHGGVDPSIHRDTFSLSHARVTMHAAWEWEVSEHNAVTHYLAFWHLP